LPYFVLVLLVIVIGAPLALLGIMLRYWRKQMLFLPSNRTKFGLL